MTAKKKTTKKVGRPETYRKEWCDLLIKHFSVPLYETKTKEIVSAGRAVVTTEEVARDMPSIHGFCVDNNIPRSTLYDNAKNHKELSDTLDWCREQQIRFLVAHGLNGNYNSGFAKFLLINMSDYRDKVEQQVDGEIKVVLPDERATKL